MDLGTSSILVSFVCVLATIVWALVLVRVLK